MPPPTCIIVKSMHILFGYYYVYCHILDINFLPPPTCIIVKSMHILFGYYYVYCIIIMFIAFMFIAMTTHSLLLLEHRSLIGCRMILDIRNVTLVSRPPHTHLTPRALFSHTPTSSPQSESPDCHVITSPYVSPRAYKRRGHATHY